MLSLLVLASALANVPQVPPPIDVSNIHVGPADHRPIPGLSFSWGPRGTGAIAFVDADGRLTLLDKEKHTQRVAGAKDATLPAWTSDGAHLAWLQKTAKKKYTLMVAPAGE